MRAAKRILITGSNGLIVSEACLYFGQLGFSVHGLDNNQHPVFFGREVGARCNHRRPQHTRPGFTQHELDIRERKGLAALEAQVSLRLMDHTAAQPLHD